MKETGYVLYFSDRRTNRDRGPDGTATITAPFGDDRETGEFGWENFVNSTHARSEIYGVFDAGEDMNGNGAQERYGEDPRYV